MSVFSACLKLQANSSFWEQNDFFSGEEPSPLYHTPLPLTHTASRSLLTGILNTPLSISNPYTKKGKGGIFCKYSLKIMKFSSCLLIYVQWKHSIVCQTFLPKGNVSRFFGGEQNSLSLCSKTLIP